MKHFSVEYHGSICLLSPLTQEAKEWTDLNLPEDAMTFGRAIVIEPRYLEDILLGIAEAGME